MKKIIKSKNLPIPIGPYSQGNKIGNLIFLSGQIAINNEGAIIDNDIKKQTYQIFENVKAFIEEENLKMDNVIKTTVYMRNIKDFSIVNNIYAEYFKENFPARSVVEVSGLPKDVLIEMEFIINED